MVGRAHTSRGNHFASLLLFAAFSFLKSGLLAPSEIDCTATVLPPSFALIRRPRPSDFPHGSLDLHTPPHTNPASYDKCTTHKIGTPHPITTSTRAVRLNLRGSPPSTPPPPSPRRRCLSPFHHHHLLASTPLSPFQQHPRTMRLRHPSPQVTAALAAAGAGPWLLPRAPRTPAG